MSGTLAKRWIGFSAGRGTGRERSSSGKGVGGTAGCLAGVGAVFGTRDSGGIGAGGTAAAARDGAGRENSGQTQRQDRRRVVLHGSTPSLEIFRGLRGSKVPHWTLTIPARGKQRPRLLGHPLADVEILFGRPHWGYNEASLGQNHRA